MKTVPKEVAQGALCAKDIKGKNAARKLTDRNVASVAARNVTKEFRQKKGEAGGFRKVRKLRPIKGGT